MLNATSALSGQAFSLLPDQVALGLSSDPLKFPDPEAVLDLDFVAQRYWWNGASRTTGEFTTYVLNGSTFGAQGLTPTDTIDITVNVSAFWSAPGAFAARLFPTANPAAPRHAFMVSDGTDANYASINQNISSGQHRLLVAVASAAVGLVPLNGTLNVPSGFAASFDVNDDRMYRDGVAGALDNIATLPSPTVLRIGRSNTGGVGTSYVGAIGRFTLYNPVQTNAWLQDRSSRIRL